MSLLIGALTIGLILSLLALGVFLFDSPTWVRRRIVLLALAGGIALLLASVYSGAFHPTAEGQAAIADAVVEKARGVLAKYESRRRSSDTPGPRHVQ